MTAAPTAVRGEQDIPRSLVLRARCGLVAISIASAALWTLSAAGLAYLSTGRAAVTGVMAVLVAAAILLWDRAVWSVERVALWIEEREGRLDFALITAVGQRPVDRATGVLLARAVLSARVDVRRLLARSALRRLGPAAAAGAVTVLLFAVPPGSPAGRPRGGAPAGTPLATGRRRAGGRLAHLSATVIPPAYTRRAEQQISEPTEIVALVGSRVILRGRGDPTGIRALEGAADLSVTTVDGDWAVALSMPRAPALVRLVDPDAGGSEQSGPAHRERLVTLAPVADAPPAVDLLLPVHDSVMRRAHGVLALRARATDDIALASAQFEVIVTAGDEEAGGVHGRTYTLGRRLMPPGQGSADLSVSIALDTLALTPGAVLSIRAVARDGNTVSGPGEGSSETRTLRVARSDELDSVAIEAAAPGVTDSSVLSERVVIIGTNALIGRIAHPPAISLDSLTRRSAHLADRQEAVRRGITAVMTAGDEMALPIADALSAPERALLDSAAAAMSEASARLAARSPRRALPSEQHALVFLDSARSLARRLYLRGRPPRLVIDVDRVRLSGHDTPDPAPRTAGGAGDTLSARSLARLIAADDQLHARGASVGRQAAIDSLTALRVAALSPSPALATAIDQVIGALRAGRDASPALAHARAILTGRPRAVAGLWQDAAGR